MSSTQQEGPEQLSGSKEERKKAGDRIQLRPIMSGAGPLNVLSTQDSDHTRAGVPEKMQDPKGGFIPCAPTKGSSPVLSLGEDFPHQGKKYCILFLARCALTGKK